MYKRQAEALALFTLSLLMTYLSKISTDLIIYSMDEINYITFNPKILGVSSQMPHKANPDPLEIIRGYSAIVTSNIPVILNILRAIPSGYNRDLQLTKYVIIDVIELVKDSIKIMTKVFKSIDVDGEAISTKLNDPGIYTTDLAEYIFMKLGKPYRMIYRRILEIYKSSRDRKEFLSKLSNEFNISFNELDKVASMKYAIKARGLDNSKIYENLVNDLKHFKNEVAELESKIKSMYRAIDNELENLVKQFESRTS